MQQMPFDKPSSAAFIGDDLIVTNDCCFGGGTPHLALFDLCVTGRGLPDYVPARSGQRYWKRLAVTGVTWTIPHFRCWVVPP